MAQPTDDEDPGLEPDPLPDTAEEPAHVGVLHRARRWSHASRPRRVVWQTGVLVVGLACVGAGVAMLVLPGPGWAAIILGLVILASEYAWAHRVLEPIRTVAEKAAQAALDPARRRRNIVLLVLAAVVAATAVAWYLTVFGTSLDGLRWLPGI